MPVASLGENCLGRTLPFYKKISEDHEIIVAGPFREKQGFCPGYDDLMNYYKIRVDSKRTAWEDIRNLMKENFDLIHCFKMRPGSYPVALFLQHVKRKPLILDIDDLDFVAKNFFENFSVRGIFHALHRLSKKTVATEVLRKMYGGTVIPTSTNVNFVKPNAKGSKELKEELGLRDNFVILFRGSVRPYKGLDIVLEAIRLTGKKDIKVVVVSKVDNYLQSLIDKYGDFMKVLPPQPYDNLPQFFGMSDLVVLPQKGNVPWSVVQVPLKLYDAMAAGKPIIVSDIGDLPAVVSDAGIVIKDGDVQACADAMLKIYNDPALAKELGSKARDRAVKEYSWEALKEKTLQVYNETLNH